MDIEKFTDRARGFLQAAQTIAIREYHQQVTPAHLAKALLDDAEGAASGLIRAAGGDPARVKQALESALAKLPKVSGGGAGQPQFTPDIVRVLDAAQQQASKAGDEFVAQDRLLVALAASEGARASTSLSPVLSNRVVPARCGGASGPAAIGVHGHSPIASSRTQWRAGNQARSTRIEVSCRVRVSSSVK